MAELTLCFSLLLSVVHGELQMYIFEQKLDHFNQSEVRTFEQRYWIQDDHWDRQLGSPVMLIFGEADVVVK